MLIYLLLFHIDFNTVLFQGPTKCWSTHQLNSIYAVAWLGFIYKIQIKITIGRHIFKTMIGP